MKKLLLALALALVCTLSLAQLKELKVAIDPTYEPFTYKAADGKPAGFDVDIANALCEQIKRKCVFVEQMWDSLIPGLMARQYDAIISSMSITQERAKTIDFTDRYYHAPSRLVLKKEIKYSVPNSIKGKKIGVLQGSTHEKYALGELQAAGVEVVAYDELGKIYQSLKAGELDGTVADLVEVSTGFLDRPEGRNYALAGQDLYLERYFGIGAGIGLRKSDLTLKAELNLAIKTLRGNGVYKKINDKYFPFDAYGK